MDFNNYKFRCSGLSNLMVNPRNKKDKLSVTTKTYLKEVYISEVFGRLKDVSTKFMEKGIWREEESLDLVSTVRNQLLVKNKETLENDFIKGTPDIVLDDCVLDIKTAWDIFTFGSVDGVIPAYYWQLQGYMALTGKERASLIYTLVDTPLHLISREISRQSFERGFYDGTPEYIFLEEEIERNLTYSDIDPKLRIKEFEVLRDDAALGSLYNRIAECRHYLNTLKL